jgi:hypothetical protein
MVVDSMPAVVTSIARPASVIVISQEVAGVVVSLPLAGELADELDSSTSVFIGTNT